MTKSCSHSVAKAVTTSLLAREGSLTGAVKYGEIKKSKLYKEFAEKQIGETTDLKRRAKHADPEALLAIDFVVFPHSGEDIEGLDYYYFNSRLPSQKGHRFLSAALVNCDSDPVPLALDFTVSKHLPTPSYPYYTPNQTMLRFVTECLEQKVPFSGLLLDGEFSPDIVIPYAAEHNLSVLLRVRKNLKVEFAGQNTSLSSLAQQFPPQKCHFYSDLGFRAKRINVSRNIKVNFKPQTYSLDLLIVWRKVSGVWKVFFLFSTFPQSKSLRQLLKSWKARWKIEVFHRYIKQNLCAKKGQFIKIQAHINWLWCVIEAFLAVLEVRKMHPGNVPWKHAQHLAFLNAKSALKTDVFPITPLLSVA